MKPGAKPKYHTAPHLLYGTIQASAPRLGQTSRSRARYRTGNCDTSFIKGTYKDTASHATASVHSTMGVRSKAGAITALGWSGYIISHRVTIIPIIWIDKIPMRILYQVRMCRLTQRLIFAAQRPWAQMLQVTLLSLSQLGRDSLACSVVLTRWLCATFVWR